MSEVGRGRCHCALLVAMVALAAYVPISCRNPSEPALEHGASAGGGDRLVDSVDAIDLIRTGDATGLGDALSDGLDPNTMDENMTSLLAKAAAWGEPDIVRTLLEHPGVVVDRPNYRGATALTYAAHGAGTADIVGQLLDAGADPDWMNSRGFCPVHAAADVGDVEILGKLIDAGAYLDARDRWGRTALHFAAGAGHTEAAKTLLAAGADAGLCANDAGLSPARAAKEAGHDELASLLGR